MRAFVIGLLMGAIGTRLLLAAAGGTGGFPSSAFPADVTWTRAGTVLSPSVAWESTSIQEPDVHWDGSQFVMWAKGGWATTGMGYYTSPDGLTWTPNAGNPVLGAGGSGWAPEVSQSSVFIDGATYYCYFNSGGDSDPNTPRYATSTDGITWTVGGSGSYVTNPGAITQWGNRTVWKESGTWYMLQEARATRWKIYYLTSPDGLSWTIGNSSNPLTTLAVDPLGTYGGPTFAEVNGTWTPKWRGTYHVWYHATPAAGDTPTNLYHSTSTDKLTWTTPDTVLTHLGSGDEVDQIADPSVLQVGDTAYLFYAGVDNTAQTGVIRLATYPALVSGADFEGWSGSTLNPAWAPVYAAGDSGFGLDSEFGDTALTKVSVAGGILTITATKARSTGSHDWDSACIGTNGSYEFLYGTMECEIKYPQGMGVWPAFWMLQTGPVSSPPEIDVLEAYPGANALGTPGENYISSTLHWGGSPHTTQYNTGSDNTAEWHTYRMIWSPGVLQFYFDGSLYFTVSSDVPSTPMYPILNLALGVSGYRADGTTPSTLVMQARDMRVWEA